MAQVNGGEATPPAGRGISRRQFGAAAASALIAGGYYCLIGRNWRPNNASNQSTIDPDKELAALAAANQGKPILGNAPGHYPERAVDLARAATNLIVVTYMGTDTASIGTAWKAQIGDKDNGSEITLATAGHVLTDHGRRLLSDINGIWIGHPFASGSFIRLDPRLARAELASGGSQSVAAGDAGIVRLPEHIAPPQLVEAPALRLATPGEVQPGTPLLVSGVPMGFVPQFSAAGIEATPLYAQVMLPRQSAAIPSGCFGLHGLSGAGVSGASAVDPEGRVVGIVVDYVTADPHITIAAPVDALRQFA